MVLVVYGETFIEINVYVATWRKQEITIKSPFHGFMKDFRFGFIKVHSENDFE